jgi:hypothetical protein
MKTPQIIITLTLAWLASTLMSLAGSEESTQGLLKAYLAANAKDMSAYFSEDVKFLGDSKFIGKNVHMVDPIALTKEELSKSYRQLFEKVGKEKWIKLLKNLKPTSQISKEGGEYKGMVKKGDIIYDMHLREALKGKRRGLDEAVIFIFRKIGDNYLIVGHVADY